MFLLMLCEISKFSFPINERWKKEEGLKLDDRFRETDTAGEIHEKRHFLEHTLSWLFWWRFKVTIGIINTNVVVGWSTPRIHRIHDVWSTNNLYNICITFTTILSERIVELINLLRLFYSIRFKQRLLSNRLGSNV